MYIDLVLKTIPFIHDLGEGWNDTVLNPGAMFLIGGAL